MFINDLFNDKDKPLNEVSNELLGRYKKAAGADATAADKRGDIEQGNKRFKGIVKATVKQGENDVKRHKEQGVAEGRGFRGVGGARSREDDEGYSRGKHGDQKAQELEYIKAVQAEKARKEAEKAKQHKGVAETSNQLVPHKESPMNLSSDYAYYIVGKGNSLLNTFKKLFARANTLPPEQRDRFYDNLANTAANGHLGDTILAYSNTLSLDDLLAIDDVFDAYGEMFHGIAFPDDFADYEAAWKQYASDVILARTHHEPGQTMHEQGVAEGSELKQAKRKYNQAAKDANLDQVGAGKKIDTMKKSLRQKDLGKEQVMAEGSSILDILDVPEKVLRTAQDAARGMPTGTVPGGKDDLGSAAGDLANTATKVGKQVIDTARDAARGMPTGTVPKPQKDKGVDESEMPNLSPEMERARQMQQIMLSDTPPRGDNLNMLKAWAEYSPHRRIDYYVIAKFGNKGPNRNIFSNSVQKTLTAISNFPDMSGQQLYDQFDLDQRDADRLYVAYENVADDLEQGVAEGSTQQDSKSWNRVMGDFDRVMTDIERSDPEVEKQHQQAVKKRINTQRMAGPRGRLPEGTGCNITEEGRSCPAHGIMECPGYSRLMGEAFKMPPESVQDRMHRRHQEIRKKSGLPDPSHYKELAKKKQQEIDALRAEIEADKAKGLTEERYLEELQRAGYDVITEKKIRQRLDPKCWKGKHKEGTKIKGGVRVNNCVPNK